MRKIALVVFFISGILCSQEVPLKVVTEDIPSRLAFYAINENEQDFDVMITISGTNFRQSKGRPRLIRVPGASKVHLKTIILLRGKEPNFTYTLKVNDSLSRRALRKEAKSIKIRPKKSITVYITEECNVCDSIISPLEKGKYKFSTFRLNENPEIKKQLRGAFPSSLDSITTPIINLGGRLYTRIENYEQLLEALNTEKP